MIIVSSNQLVTPHWLIFKTGEKYAKKDLFYASLSGVFLIDFSGRERSKNGWLGEKVRMLIPTHFSFPDIGDSTVPDRSDYIYAPSFKLKHWTVYAGLSAVENQQPSSSSGYAVDSFGIGPENSNLREIVHINNNAQLEIYADIAISDEKTAIHRMGYQVNLLGYYDKSMVYFPV